MNFLIGSFLTFLLSCSLIEGQTIAEKKAGIVTGGTGGLSPDAQKMLGEVNTNLCDTQDEIAELYQNVQMLYQSGAPLEVFEPSLLRIRELRSRLKDIEVTWREKAASFDDETYALWHQPETTIGQLVNDYGSQDYVYVSPPEVSKLKISIDSSLPIPRCSWDEMLQLILNQSGIGVRQLSPFLRELYLLQKNSTAPQLITDRREELEFYPGDARVVFVLTPEPAEGKRIWFFLNKFVNPASTVLYMIGRDILIIAKVNEVNDLLKVYDFVASHKGDREYKAVTINKIDVDEMARVLGSIFDLISEPLKAVETSPSAGDVRGGKGPGRDNQSASGSPDRGGSRSSQEVYGSSLKIIPLKNVAQALFLVGTKEEISKAEEIIAQVENQLGDARKKVIFSYRVRHSDADELGHILEHIYSLMIESGPGIEDNLVPPMPPPFEPPLIPPEEFRAPEIQLGLYDQGYYLTDRFIVNPDQRRPRRPPPNLGRNNFIVDPKTGLLVMVVEVDILERLKELIKKLDVPKKMVQIEVMLVEQVSRFNDSIGLNLLQIGTQALNITDTSLIFNAAENALAGITDFIISRPGTCSTPAYDAIYRFLVSRDDVRINASPSLLIMNETLGTIEIEEEISVQTGTFVIPTAGTQTLSNAFARARYGIRLDITPTIHMRESDDPFVEGEDDIPNYVTLLSDIKFETINANVTANAPTTPDVTRRVIKNEARIADGQTVIIGGLRRKNSADVVNSVPFIGELPGIGKLFSTTSILDQSTEMFIFMTPKIVTDPSEDLDRIRCEEMVRRPGDIPGFMCALHEAQKREREEVLAGTMRLLFGRVDERCVDLEACKNGVREGEYDGRNSGRRMRH
ncbi:MAG: type II secretion system protein GspD [Parachlamydiaceae bacterium]|nr:type II secretion system protein GspD [Parachlamydiaceae bacterium]